MSGKTKHMVERGGRFWARLVVPVELRPIIGKTELREPLGADRRVAERKLHPAIARILNRIEEARRKLQLTNVVSIKHGKARPRLLTIEQLARTHYGEELDIDDALRNDTYDDGTPVFTGIEGEVFRPVYAKVLQKVAAGHASNEETAAAIGWAVDKFVSRGNSNEHYGSDEWRKLARTLAGVQLESLRRLDERDMHGDTSEPTLPILQKAPVVELRPSPTLNELFEAYLREIKASGRGEKADRRWRPVFRDLEIFMTHGDARQISRADIVRWKDGLLSRLQPKTIKDVYLAAVRAVLGWSVDNGYLTINPASGVKVRGAKPERNRERGFNRSEALALLKAAHSYTAVKSSNPQTCEAQKTSAAKRWTPWLAAYTGARISELTQLRKEDLREEDSIHYIRIAPAAGSVKGNQYRDVPLHSHLIDLGYLTFVEMSEPGPLFFTESNSNAASSPAETVSGRVSKWIRNLNIIGDVAPNHGWRHRFKTIGIEEGMESRVLDALQGHAARTAGENYGEVTLKAKHLAIEKHPRYIIS